VSDQEAYLFCVEEREGRNRKPVYYVVALLNAIEPVIVQFTPVGFEYCYGEFGKRESIKKTPQEFVNWLTKELNGKNKDQLSAIRNYLSLKFNIALT
jgi:hypothetical protein